MARKKSRLGRHGQTEFRRAVLHALVIAVGAKDRRGTVLQAVAFETFPNGGAVVERGGGGSQFQGLVLVGIDRRI